MAPILVTIGLFHGLVRGLKMGLFLIGEALADAMAQRGHPAWRGSALEP